MTSDTKIGLLLGLVFIFVIAFLINGVPGVPLSRASNELTENMALYDAGMRELGTVPREVGREMTPSFRPFLDHGGPSSRLLPSGPETRPLAEFRDSTPIPLDLMKNAESVLEENLQQEQTPTESSATLPSPQRRPRRIHEVQPGDNLGTIAMHYYGDRKGHWQATLDALYEANRHQLKSRDDLVVGQKLIIPPLPPIVPAALQEVTHEVPGVGSQGRQGPVARETTTWYQVRDGDSLWKIAERLLGDGNRCQDILLLNKDAVSDPHSVMPGMRLKLPAR